MLARQAVGPANRNRRGSGVTSIGRRVGYSQRSGERTGTAGGTGGVTGSRPCAGSVDHRYGVPMHAVAVW